MKASALTLALVSLALFACSVPAAEPTPTTVPPPTLAPTAAIPPSPSPSPTRTQVPTLAPTTNPAQAEVEDLQASGLLASGGRFVPVQTRFTISEAQRNYWIWYGIEDAGTPQDFAIGADVSWEAASDRSDWWNTGCGFFLRPRDENGDGGYFVAQTADGLPWLLWAKPGAPYLVDLLRPGSYDYYANASPGEKTGSQHIVALAQGATLAFLVDGDQKIYRDDIDARPGFIGAVVVSGTNKDFGTRCDFSNLWLYVMDSGS